MSFKQISDNVTASINDLYRTTCLDELLQRALTSNYESIRDYILKDNERFFNAIILAIYDGDPQWLEVEFSEEESEYTNVGFLQFSGKEVIFPVDGQHRVAGIAAAIAENPELSVEQVPVIFIAHSNDDQGMMKTRKLFSTLNRRAKPVGQNENIALDEDDISSIITRDLVQNVPLCMGSNIVNSLGKQIPSSNEEAFTSLITLYQCVELLVKHKLGERGVKGKRYSDYKLYRPKDEEISELKEYILNVFEAFVEHTDVIKEYVSLTEVTKAQKFRNSAGGNLLFRPIALTEYFEAAHLLCNRGCAGTYAEAFDLLNIVELDIAKQPWIGLVWDGTKIINRASKTVIRSLLLFMVNASVLSQREQEKLISDYASSINSSHEDVSNYLASIKQVEN
jgi:DNA sulfur modification protein DndB